MKIDFFEIPLEGRSFTFQGPDWIPEDLITQGDVSASLFMRSISGRIIVTGEYAVTLVLQCDRCLEEFACPLGSRFEIDIELPGRDVDFDGGEEFHFEENEMDVFILDGDKIDMHELLRQQLYLALPMKILCSDDCKGICNKCGANRNSDKCTCVPETDSPFAKLAGLKIK